MEQLDLVKSEDSYSEAEIWKRVEGDYVLLRLVERAADVVDESRGGMSLTDSLHTVESFRNEFGSKVLPGVTLSETDTKVLLRYLERDRRILVLDKDVCFLVICIEHLLIDIRLGHQIHHCRSGGRSDSGRLWYP